MTGRIRGIKSSSLRRRDVREGVTKRKNWGIEKGLRDKWDNRVREEWLSSVKSERK